MPLLEFFSASPDAVAKMTLAQIISACGEGELKDGSECCREFREYLRRVDSARIRTFVDTCLTPGAKQGFALQDLVNEVGRRLDLSVEHGRFQGVQNAIGFDGIWQTSSGQSIVVEVKTTDAYRINLDTIAQYRQRLIDDGRVGRNSSILIVVLREDTGDLEAQVRGSRHAWDVRIISVDALLKLLEVKERTESTTLRQIEEILVPFEYTRLDKIINITFAAVMDVEDDAPEVLSKELEVALQTSGESRDGQIRTPISAVEAARAAAISATSLVYGKELLKRSRAKYESADGSVRVVCAVSKQYDDGGLWYAFHPEYNEFLAKGEHSTYILVGVGLDGMFAIPRSWLATQLEHLWRTERDGSGYWHIIVKPNENGWILQRREVGPASLNEFWRSATT